MGCYVIDYLFVDVELYSILGTVGLGAALNVAKPTKGSTVAIFGLGAVGLAVSVTNPHFFVARY